MIKNTYCIFPHLGIIYNFFSNHSRTDVLHGATEEFIGIADYSIDKTPSLKKTPPQAGLFYYLLYDRCARGYVR